MPWFLGSFIPQRVHPDLEIVDIDPDLVPALRLDDVGLSHFASLGVDPNCLNRGMKLGLEWQRERLRLSSLQGTLSESAPPLSLKAKRPFRARRGSSPNGSCYQGGFSFGGQMTLANGVTLTGFVIPPSMKS